MSILKERAGMRTGFFCCKTVKGSMFQVQGSRLHVSSSRFKVACFKFKVQGFMFQVQSSKADIVCFYGSGFLNLEPFIVVPFRYEINFDIFMLN